ncbi:MAG: hypothetical protein M1483_08390 [Actinobacteria bacterium]|nr:hypothetical protein [Actinomycetota bacterium]
MKELTNNVHSISHRTREEPLYVYAPIIQIFNRLGEVVKPIQSGNVNLYLAYVFIAFLVAVLVR